MILPRTTLPTMTLLTGHFTPRLFPHPHAPTACRDTPRASRRIRAYRTEKRLNGCTVECANVCRALLEFRTNSEIHTHRGGRKELFGRSVPSAPINRHYNLSTASYLISMSRVKTGFYNEIFGAVYARLSTRDPYTHS